MQPGTPPPQTHTDDEIDLRQLITVLWRQKALIVGIGALCAVLGLGASLASTKHVTDGLFLTPGVSADNYKRYENVFSSGTRLQQFLQTTGHIKSADGELLSKLAEVPDNLRDALKPEFAFTDRDQKAFGVKLDDDKPSAMLGVRIQLEHKDPTGGTPVALLAEYVRDSIIRVNMEATMLAQCTEYSTREQELRNAQIQNDFAIRQEEGRLANLREIIARNPTASTIDNRQIVSLEKGTERFLSPAAQLVASEIHIADMKLADARRKRERIASALKRDYYCQAQQALQQPTNGREFLQSLANIQTIVFQGHDRTLDIVEQTWNEIDVQRENWSSTYLLSMRFVASPEGAEVKVRKPGIALGLVLGGMLGGMLGMMIALVRSWWRNEGEATATAAA